MTALIGVDMATDEIDFKALFEQVQGENEKLRINIVKLKNDEISLFEGIKEKIADIVESDYFHIYLYAAIMIFVAVIVPMLKELFNYIFRRKHEG
jgi:hypothetical protein